MICAEAVPRTDAHRPVQEISPAVRRPQGIRRPALLLHHDSHRILGRLTPRLIPAAVLAAAFLAAPALHGQSVEIRGRVIDSISGEPVEGALVRVQATRSSTLTDARGAFVLTGRAGPDTLAIERFGYRPLTVAIDVRPGAFQTIELVPAPLTLDSLRIIDARRITRQMNAAATLRALAMASVSEPVFWRSWDREAILTSGIDDAFLFMRRGPPRVGMYPCATLGAPPDRLCVSTPFSGRTTRVTVYLDDRPLGALEALQSLTLAEIHRIETYGYGAERGIRLYTEPYLRLVGAGIIRP